MGEEQELGLDVSFEMPVKPLGEDVGLTDKREVQGRDLGQRYTLGSYRWEAGFRALGLMCTRTESLQRKKRSPGIAR